MAPTDMDVPAMKCEQIFDDWIVAEDFPDLPDDIFQDLLDDLMSDTDSLSSFFDSDEENGSGPTDWIYYQDPAQQYTLAQHSTEHGWNIQVADSLAQNSIDEHGVSIHEVVVETSFDSLIIYLNELEAEDELHTQNSQH